jgi:hydroxyacylglutathione hydrolase
MFFEQVYERGLAQASYIVGCQASGTAIVIDPRRDIDPYLSIARREGLTITKVTETHIHADYLSGARELAAATGAELLLSDEGGVDWQYRFPHTGLHDGDSIEVGRIRLDVIHTPGHTPEHLSFLLFDLPTGDQPRMLFTGDFLFVGDLGRPDLLEEAAGVVGSREVGAHQMYDSLEKTAWIPDHVLIWPGHGAGSACGKSLGAVPTSTMGFERATAWAFRSASEDAFVDELLDGQPEPPRYFGQMKRLNRERPGASLLLEVPSVPERSVADIATAARHGDIQLVDVRDAAAFAGAPVEGAINVPFDVGMSTWFGWLLDFERDIVIVSSREQKDDVLRSLIRIGLDRIVGWVDASTVVGGGQQNGSFIHRIEPAEAARLQREGALIVDVRGRSEYEEGHIEGAHHLLLGRIPVAHDELPRDRALVVHCQGGYRSAIACSLLRTLGFDMVYDVVGGYEAWEATADALPTS